MDSGADAAGLIRTRLVPYRACHGVDGAAAGNCPRTPELPAFIRHSSGGCCAADARHCLYRTAEDDECHAAGGDARLCSVRDCFACRQFGDEVRRTQLEAQHHRTSARSQHEAGRVLAEFSAEEGAGSPAYSLAKAHYELAGQLDPSFKMNWLGLIHLNCQAHLPVERVWLGELENRLRNTPFAPGDKTILYSLKEMAIAGSICLDRADVDSLFAAAIANPGVSKGVGAMLHSWHADYLWLRESDLPAARAALRQSLALNSWSPSNRLKWAQLQFIVGERDDARKLLLELPEGNLSTEERKTRGELLATLGILGR